MATIEYHAGAADAEGDRGPEAGGRVPRGDELRPAADRRGRTSGRNAGPRDAAIGAAGDRACERDRAPGRAQARLAHARSERRRRSPRTARTSSPPPRPARVGGALGLAALPVELPISTTILLRSIAEIAREEGEDLSAPDAAFACVEVFALGGQGAGEAAFESGYFAVRAALAKSVSDSARFVAAKGSPPFPRRWSRG